MTNQTSRRNFLKLAVAGAASLPILNNINAASAQAAPTTAVSASDPMASALGYVVDATKVDKAKFPKYQAGQLCKNCVLYLEGGKTVTDAKGEHGKCGLFQNGLVAANGWCNSYAPKA
jgi:hypothetical protein